MDWDLQRLVQVFLVVGGAGYVIWGGATRDVVLVGLGVLGIAVGGIGLMRDRRMAATDEAN